jgi:hypothetical protein
MAPVAASTAKVTSTIAFMSPLPLRGPSLLPATKMNNARKPAAVPQCGFRFFGTKRPSSSCPELPRKYNGVVQMAKDEHNKAAEHHENAAKSHRAAAEHHGKNDHAKGKEHSANAQQHSQNARQHSEQAHSKSQQQK